MQNTYKLFSIFSICVRLIPEFAGWREVWYGVYHMVYIMATEFRLWPLWVFGWNHRTSRKRNRQTNTGTQIRTETISSWCHIEENLLEELCMGSGIGLNIGAFKFIFHYLLAIYENGYSCEKKNHKSTYRANFSCSFMCFNLQLEECGENTQKGWRVLCFSSVSLIAPQITLSIIIPALALIAPFLSSSLLLPLPPAEDFFFMACLSFLKYGTSAHERSMQWTSINCKSSHNIENWTIHPGEDDRA